MLIISPKLVILGVRRSSSVPCYFYIIPLAIALLQYLARYAYS